jgi:hypothetical protein
LHEVTTKGTAVVITDAETLLGDLVLRASLEKAHDAGAIDAGETARLITGVEEAGRTGTCFFSFTIFTACGQ